MKELTLNPSLENIEKVTEFVEDTLAQSGCPMKAVIKLNIVVDELYSNIARYSGADNVTISCGVNDGCIILSFRDNGKEYDPTAQDEPDITLSLDERQVGGLGIFMVKKTMDELTYEYSGGENIVTAKLKL